MVFESVYGHYEHCPFVIINDFVGIGPFSDYEPQNMKVVQNQQNH